MNKIEEFYNFLDQSNHDATTIREIEQKINSIYDFLDKDEQTEKEFLRREGCAFACRKSFDYKNDESKGTLKGLSPMFSEGYELEDGTRVTCFVPNVRDFTDDDFVYYEERYNNCRNLYAKTEYGLLVYFGQRTPTSKQISFKKALCDDLFELSKTYYSKALAESERNWYVAQYFLSLGLSLKIAVITQSVDGKDMLVSHIFETHQNCDLAQRYMKQILGGLSNLMLEHFEVFKNKINWISVENKNRTGAQELEEIDLDGAEYLIELNLKIDKKQGKESTDNLTYQAELNEKIAENRTPAFVKMNFIEKALRIYKDLKNDAKVKELESIYEKLKGEIQLTTHYSEFPDEVIESIDKEIFQIVNDGDEEKILNNLAQRQWYDTIDSIQEMAKRNNNPLLDIMGRTMLDVNGNTLERSGINPEDVEKQKFWEYYNLCFQTGSRVIHQLILEAVKSGKLSYDSIIRYLEKTWYNQPIQVKRLNHDIEVKILDALKPGLKLCFSELDKCLVDKNHSYDYLPIVDTLTPKIEMILRYSLKKIAYPTFKFKQNNLVMERLLDELIADLENKPDRPTGFLEEDRKLLQYVLTTKGMNLRNRVAHGLMDAFEYNFLYVISIMIIILRLSQYTFTPQK